MKAFKARIAEISEYFNVFTKDELHGQYWSNARVVALKHLDIYIKAGAKQDELNQILEPKNPNKQRILNACALAFYNQETYQAFLHSLTPNVQKLWEALIWSGKLYHSEIIAKLDFNAFKLNTSGFYNRYDLLSEFKLFKELKTDYYYYSGREPGLALPMPLRGFVHQYHQIPLQANLHPLEVCPPTKLKFVEGEQQIFQELPRIVAYFQQGQISYTAKRRPAHTTLGKFQRVCAIQEFFDKSEDKRKGKTNLRSGLIAAMLPYLRSKELELPLAQLVRKIFQYYNDQIYSAPIVLPDLKGMGYLDDYTAFQRVEMIFFKLFKLLPTGAWLSFENIQQHAYYNILEFKSIREYSVEQKLYYEYDDPEEKSTYRDNKHPVKLSQYFDAIELPFLRGSFFLFAAFGLCDLMYEEPELDKIGRSCFSSWDGLRYVRRTALGDYVCGVSAEYDASQMQGQTEIHLSEDTLLIQVEGDSKASITLLESYAERVSPNSLRTDSRIFLRNVSSAKDLGNKINLFKQFIGKPLPPNWLSFFQTLEQKVNPFESPGDYQLYKIPAHQKELIQLVAQDFLLKTMVIKAEGYIILVNKAALPAFKKRLQEFGYYVA